MYKYTGDFEYLKQLGFVKNIFGKYWFLPTTRINKYDNPLVINIDNRTIEFCRIEQLDIIKDKIVKL